MFSSCRFLWCVPVETGNHKFLIHELSINIHITLRRKSILISICCSIVSLDSFIKLPTLTTLKFIYGEWWINFVAQRTDLLPIKQNDVDTSEHFLMRDAAGFDGNFCYLKLESLKLSELIVWKSQLRSNVRRDAMEKMHSCWISLKTCITCVKLFKRSILNGKFRVQNSRSVVSIFV